MEKRYYTVEKGTQCLIALLKAHGIKKIIASPGTTNMVFVGSIQQDPWFEVYSSVDERSAAYIACGMAAESGEPVAVTCTGATASRNYMPGMTEAFYRKLPVLAITYNAGVQKKHHLIPQQIDRSSIPVDTARMAVDIPVVKDDADAWLANVNINKALLALRHEGGGPVHINISTAYSCDFSAQALPPQRVIYRVMPDDEFPKLCNDKKIAIIIGSHRRFTEKETEAIDRFCAAYNAVVFCDHTSGYYGKYRFLSALLGSQPVRTAISEAKLLIHLGEVSGDYYRPVAPEEVWRVNPDGEIKDTFHCLKYVFQMPEKDFFEKYTPEEGEEETEYLHRCQEESKAVAASIPELPFGNIWVAQHTAYRFPAPSVVHLGILNTLRSWNLFDFPEGVQGFCNVGGFGIDGDVSTLIGASLVSPDKICFAIVGDLAFFYDLNSLGNRHIGPNVRIMLINNGRGTEFTNYCHPCSAFGEEAKPFMAAAGHFGNKSHALVKNYAEDLGFEYLSATDKASYEAAVGRFLTSEITDKPMLFEVFTDGKEESDALETILTLRTEGNHQNVAGKIKSGIKSLVGDKGRRIINIIRE